MSIIGNSVELPIGTTIDPGGIGKGLAADLVCALALGAGAFGALAEVGGDVVAHGRAPRAGGWLLGIEDPFRFGSHAGTVRVASGALATSSSLKRRFVTAVGTRHHLIDRLGHSADTSVRTVSVLAASGSRAEVLTKPGFVRNPEEYLRWLPTVGAAGLVIDDSGAIRTSTNWERYS
jgi:thiamine biosynthesis lipoprotein